MCLLLIEDDHFSLLAQSPYHSIIGPDQHRWALVRSVSKFLGPDLRLAFVASDPATAQRLGLRLAPGGTWVSHILQRAAHRMVIDADTADLLDRAAAHYAERNRAFRKLLGARGIDGWLADGLNVWVDTGADASEVSTGLMRRGWLVRTGDTFRLDSGADATHLRLTVHTLDDAALDRLATDLADAIADARMRDPATRTTGRSAIARRIIANGPSE
ncbi:hypothetical protein ACFQE5_04670 [Pseudonocardia hispaniensis]|uniref:Aminotransferase class I and II n=1 Tax=Pseudonocardia hispaniensis TaxID=904933 RepID=A0ABW1IYE4_9PSEU